jgi:hypothetical protein
VPIVTGGWTVDGGYVEYLDKTGYVTTLFYMMIQEAIKQKLAAIESTGDLSMAEKNLRNIIFNVNAPSPFMMQQSNTEVERILQFIRLEPKWSRGLYMPFADLKVCIDNQWTNILKKYA